MWSWHLFFIKKKKEKINTWLNCSLHWLNKIYIIGKLKNYMVLGSSYKLPNNYMAFCSSYILPKIKQIQGLDLLIQRLKSGG